jgi:hypothetical protein
VLAICQSEANPERPPKASARKEDIHSSSPMAGPTAAELLALVIMYMSSILSAVHFVAVFSSINVVQLYEYTLGVSD